MSKIGELIYLDADAEFRSDVQLDAFDKPHNLGLLKSYLFTSQAPTGYVSSMDVLETILQSFSNARLDNRMIVIANYGHGKSHLALAIANYFGREPSSAECNLLYGKIDLAIQNKAKSMTFREFKRTQPRHLVMRLRGDVLGGIRGQFIRQLDHAIASEPALKDVKMPYWFQKAEKLLKELKGEQRQKAEAYLAEFSSTIEDLLEEVQNRNMNIFDRVKQVFQHAYGFGVDFMEEVGLKEMVNWAARALCGTGKPFCGILILMDEFSLYLQNYVSRGTSNELQDLMNGLDDQRGKVAFVAFGQHDPITYVRTFNLHQLVLQDVEKELNRVTKKYLLYSLMESVVDSYLHHDISLEKELETVRGPIVNASTTAYDAFPKRYRDILRWNYETFDQRVTKGCFPLHPLTTALLCTVNLQATLNQDPRSVLGFVFNQLEQRANESVINGSSINWILPIDLVDFFNIQLSGERYRMYENAQRQLGPESLDVYHSVLKGLLLYEVAGFRTNRDDQINLIATMAGLDEGVTKGALLRLTDQHTIRRDPTSGRYSLWTAGIDISDYDGTVQARISQVTLSIEDIHRIGLMYMSPISPDIRWGAAEDWTANSHLVLVEHFTAELVRKELAGYSTKNNTLVEGRRGVVFFLLAKDTAERGGLSETVQEVIKEALAESHQPVMVVIPNDSSEKLVAALKRRKALEGLTTDQKETYRDLYNQDMAEQNAIISRGLENLDYSKLSIHKLRPRQRFIVNQEYVNAILPTANLSASQALTAIYQMAYRLSPPEFFTQYKESNSNLRSAVKMVSRALLINNIGNEVGLTTSNVGRDLINKFLIDKWNILHPGNKRIQPPSNQSVREVWDYLDSHFSPLNGEISVSQVILPLLNPPYGYDYHTLTLIYCAWFGYNAKDLQISINGMRQALQIIGNYIDEAKDLKGFIEKICCITKLTIKRQDLSENERKVNEIFEKVDQGGISISQAQGFIPALAQYNTDDRYDPARRRQAKSTEELLSREIELANRYKTESDRLDRAIQGARDIDSLIRVDHQIRELPVCNTVLPTGLTRTKLNDNFNTKIHSLVSEACKEAENLSDIKDYRDVKRRLESLRDKLRAKDFTPLVARIEAALATLDVRIVMLEKKRKEVDAKRRINEMDLSVSLKTLRSYQKELMSLEDFSPSTNVLRDDKLEKINERIKVIETTIRDLLDSIHSKTRARELTDWNRSYSVYREKVRDTEYEVPLSQAYQQYQTLNEIMTSVERIANSSFRNLGELDALFFELTNLKERNQEEFGSTIDLIIRPGKERLDSRLQDQQNQACQMLEGLEDQFSRGAPLLKLNTTLEIMPPFLSEECQPRWHDLKQRVQQKLESSLVSEIVERFKQIHDPEIKIECIRQLHDLFEK